MYLYLYFIFNNILFMNFEFQLRQLPDSVIVETTEYKCLQSHFSVLYNEFMVLRNQVIEQSGMLQNSKNTHLRQMEAMEVSHFLLYIYCCLMLNTKLNSSSLIFIY